MRGGIGQGVLEGLEPAILVGVVDPERGDLVDLETQKVDLAGPTLGIASESGERGVDLGDAPTGHP